MSSSSSKDAKAVVLAFLKERAAAGGRFFASSVIQSKHVAEADAKHALTALVKSGVLRAEIETRCAHCHRIASERIETDGDLLDCPFCGETPHRTFVSFAVTPRGEKKLWAGSRPKVKRRRAPQLGMLAALLAWIHSQPPIQN